MPDQTLRDYFERRKSAMDQERSSFIPHYKELSEFIQPRRGRFMTTDRNKGARRHQSIINSRASRAHRIARSGMFAGIMSPARPWFKLETFDKDLMRFKPVQQWLYDVERRIRDTFLESNLYGMAPTTIGELLLFATGAISHVDDGATLARFYSYPAGSYYLAANSKLQMDTFCRVFEMTVDQLVGRFGKDKVSPVVRGHFDKGEYDPWYPVTQFIEPNPNFRPGALEAKFKAFRQVYYENGDNRKEAWLEQSGFEEFPIYAPRWETTGEDVYGTNCPAMEALGDIKGLQIMERRKGQAIDKLVNPPLAGPPSLKNVPVSSLPGGVTIYDTDTNNALRPIYQVDPRVGEMRLDIQAVEQRINEAFFVDMFMAITAMPGIQPKNEFELSQRNEERLLQLGPTLEQVHGEFLAPLVDRTFNQMVRTEILPEPPAELQGQPLRIRFISVLALAQRAVEVQSIERFSSFIGAVGTAKPEAFYKWDINETVDQYAQLTGVAPSLVLDTEVANAMRARDLQAQAQAAALEQMQAMAGAASQGVGAIKQGAEAEQIAAEAAA